MIDDDETIAGYAKRMGGVLARGCEGLGRRPGSFQCIVPARWSVAGTKSCDDHLLAMVTAAAKDDRPVDVSPLGVGPAMTPDEALAAADVPLALARLQQHYSPVADRIAALAAQRDGLKRMAAWLDAPKLRAIAVLVGHGVSFIEAAMSLWTVYGLRWRDEDLLTPPSDADIQYLVDAPVVAWETSPPASLGPRPANCTMVRGPCACGSWHREDNWDQGRHGCEVAGWYDGSFGPEPARIAAMVAGRTE